jgi:acetyl-CoA carboxylase alpha subunit
MATCAVSRHQTGHTLDHVKHFADTFLELHGDRGFKDDKAMIGGLGKLVVSLLMLVNKRIQHEDRQETLGWQIRRISKSIAFDGREVRYSCSLIDTLVLIQD